MHAIYLALLALPFTVLGGSHHSRSRRHHNKVAKRSTNSTCMPKRSGSSYTLTDMYQGQDLLAWDFYSDSDPTHGNVNFLSGSDAQAQNLAYVDGNVTVLAVDSTSQVAVGGNRNSVRISSPKTYNGGLFLADLAAMPTGCGTWPAWWSVGPDWPAGGEIDIMEGVNLNTNNQYTLHTSDGCTQSTGGGGGISDLATGTVVGAQCASSNGDNNGCGVIDTDARSFGQGFNDNGGGVFAHTWDSSGIQAWHFPRGEVPEDITSGAPNPANWGNPAAVWSGDSCDMASHFYEHVLTFDITLCGDWAGSAYSGSGCPASCAEAVADPSNFANAQFKINYVAVYN